MSYDMSIGNTGFLNTTFNHRVVFEALIDGGLHSLAGLRGSQAAKVLTMALIHKLPHVEQDLREAMSTCNWGSYNAAIQYLRDLHMACIDHPRHKLHLFC
jgi:hypothetical protein